MTNTMSWPVYHDALWTIHIFSGEILILSMAFLFVRTRISPMHCLACTACVANCPANALTSEDAAMYQERYLSYSHYQCICCGNCMRCCPEDAIALGHEISLRHLFQIARKYTIHSETLCECEACGSHFIPYAQYIKVQNTISTNLILTCPSCRQRQFIDRIPH